MAAYEWGDRDHIGVGDRRHIGVGTGANRGGQGPQGGYRDHIGVDKGHIEVGDRGG